MLRIISAVPIAAIPVRKAAVIPLSPVFGEPDFVLVVVAEVLTVVSVDNVVLLIVVLSIFAEVVVKFSDSYTLSVGVVSSVFAASIESIRYCFISS